MSLKGNHVGIYDSSAHDGNGALLPRELWIDGVQILLIDEDGIRLEIGSHENITKITLTFMPASITIRGSLDDD